MATRSVVQDRLASLLWDLLSRRIAGAVSIHQFFEYNPAHPPHPQPFPRQGGREWCFRRS